MYEPTAKQLVLLLPIDKRKELLQNLQEIYEDVGDCNGITEAEGLYLITIDIVKECIEKGKNYENILRNSN